MVQPINYGVDIPDPTQSFLQSFKTGTAITETRLAQEQAQRQAEQQRQLGTAYGSLVEKVRAGTWQPADFQTVALLAPKDQSAAAIKFFESLSKDRQDQTIAATTQAMAALGSKNPDIGVQLLRNRAEGYRNQGNEAQAKFLETQAKLAEIDPAQVQATLGETLFGLPGGKEAIESLAKFREVQRSTESQPEILRKQRADADKAVADAITAQATATNAPEKAEADAKLAKAQAQKAQVEAKYADQIALADLKKKAADLGLTQAQTGSALAQTKKLGVEIAKAALELEALKASGGMDPTKTFEKEEKLRKEFQARTKVYGELGSTFSNLQASAQAKTGPGDIALITGFMKMLDPGSVVRETEFATARDTAGLFERLSNQAQKLQSGQLFSLDSRQRQEYVNLAKQYLDAAQKKAEDDKKALGVVVRNYRLNPDNVFGPEPTAAGGAGAGRGMVNPPAVQPRTVTVDY